MERSEQPETRAATRWRTRAFAEPLSTPEDAPGGKPGEESEETKKPPATRRETAVSSERRNGEETPSIGEETSLVCAKDEQKENKTRDQVPVSERCVIAGCPASRADIVYCARHRVMADDGTLWLRCVNDNGHAPVAPNDPIVCAGHRAAIEVA